MKTSVAKFTTAILFVALMLMGANTTWAQFSGSGAGTQGDPYIITTPQHLDEVRNFLEDSEVYFELGADIDLTTATGDPAGAFWNDGDGWEPIGTYEFSGTQSGFAGSLLGNDHTITGLYIDRAEDFFNGLFAYTESTASIENIHLENVSIQSSWYVGGLVGTNDGIIQNVSVTGTINSSDGVLGGIVGINDNNGQMIHTVADVEIQGDNNAIGGLAGTNRNLISTSFATGNVSTAQRAGGLVGDNNGEIINSYAVTTVSANSAAGGLVGIATGGEIQNSYAAGSVTAQSDYGGFIGDYYIGDTEIENSFWNTETTGQSDGIGNGSDEKLTGLTTAVMYDETSFTGWDFVENWQMPANSWEFAFPVLQDNPQDPAPGFIAFEGGDGSESTPLQIAEAGQLDAVRYFLDLHFELTDDIDLTTATGDPSGNFWNNGDGWEPIGNTGDPFTGTLDGNDHTITGLFINRPEENHVGLFGATSTGSVLTSLNLEAVDITGDGYVGAQVGESYGTAITKIHAEGTVHGEATRVGGLVGRGRSFKIENSGFTGVVSAGSHNTGGLVGRIDDSPFEISSSYATGNVMAGGSGAGGLVGRISVEDFEITSCYATADVTAGNDNAGGLVGEMTVLPDYNFTNNYATGAVTADIGDNEGGFIGRIGAVLPGTTVISGNYWNTETSGQTDGIGNDSHEEISGLTTAQMHDSTSFSGWDFDEVWTILQGASFPYLQDNPPETPPGLIFAGGDGNESTPWQINTPEALSAIRHFMDDPVVHFILTDDLDLGGNDSEGPFWNEGEGWQTMSGNFYGKLDGNGHTITGLYINSSSATRGLFGNLSDDSVIENVTIENASITSGSNSGILGARNINGTINDVHVSGSLSHTYYESIGGLVGINNGGVIENSSATNIEITTSGNTVGGLAGKNENDGIIRNSHTEITIHGMEGAGEIGGLVGENDASIENAYANVTINAESGWNAGGLVGVNRSNGTILASYSIGSLEAPSVDWDSEYIGGLASHNAGSISSSYSAVDVSGEDYVGGLIGINNWGTIERSFATGQVSGQNDVGGLIGEDDNGTISDSFWNTETTSQNSSDGGTGLSSMEMLSQSNFANWDFGTGTWQMYDGQSLPFLPDTGPYRIYGILFDGTAEENDAGWRMVSFPVDDFPLSELASHNLVQGISGANAFYEDDFPETEFEEDISPNLMFYSSEEPVGWTAPEQLSDTYETAGTGMIWYMFDNDIGPSKSLPFAKLFGFDEQEVDKQIPLAPNEWNLVGNPFGLDVHFDDITAGGGTASATVQYWDHETSSYILVNEGVQDSIPAGKGFFIENTDAQYLNVPFSATEESPQLQGNDSESESAIHLLSFSAAATINDGKTLEDHALSILLHLDAGEDWDRWDAGKLAPLDSDYLQLAFKGWRDNSEIMQAQISGNQDLDGSISFPLAVKSSQKLQNITLQWAGIEQLPDEWEAILIDHHTENIVDLRNSDSYVFDHEAESTARSKSAATLSSLNETGLFDNRFEIKLSSVPLSLATGSELPETFDLHQNYPNPFNPVTSIAYQLPQDSHVRIVVYDLLGRKVRVLTDEMVPAGHHQIHLDAHQLASGMYIYRIEASADGDVFTKTRKMMLVK